MDCPVGYYAGLNAEFNLKDVDNWKIGMIVGPSYSYSFGDSDVSLDGGRSHYQCLQMAVTGIGKHIDGALTMQPPSGEGLAKRGLSAIGETIAYAGKHTVHVSNI